MNQDQLKELVAREALKHVVEDAIVGVGSGSTVFKFIDALATIKGRIEGAVAASGRAIANARDEGFTKLLFDAETHRCVGGGIVGLGAGDLISEIALAVEMGADATDIGKTIHPHPTTAESVGMAAEVFEGVCTDLPPQRKR